MSTPVRLALLRVTCLLIALAVLPRAVGQDAPPPPAAAAAVQDPDAPAPDTPVPESPGQKNWFGILFSGGWVGVTIMLALFGLSFFAAYRVFEHALTIRHHLLIPAGLSPQVLELLRQGRVAEAEQLCRAQPSLLSFVLLNGLSEVDSGWPAVEKAIEDALAEQAARLFRKIEYLSVIGNIAPMLGLLGTVTGMILAFKTVAETQGAAGASDLAEGIYAALVTTVAGLVIAIPVLAAFAVFRNRVDEYVAEAGYAALHAFGPLKRRRLRSKTDFGPPPPPPVEGAR